MNTWVPWFRRWYILGGFFALFAILLFVEGSALFDSFAHTRPGADQVRAAFARHASPELRFFSLGVLQSQSEDSATVVAVLKEPLYEPTDSAALLAKLGDDPAAFAQALAQRAELSPADQPTLPTRRLPARIYAIARQPGDGVPLEFRFIASRTPRGWSLLDCLRIWTQPRAWDFTVVAPPRLPAEWSAAKPRAELEPGALITGDRDGDAALGAYVSERRAFVAQVKTRLATVLERTVTAAITADLANVIKPVSAFSVRVKMALASGSGSETSVAADVEFEAIRDLFVESPETLAAWNVDPLARALADSRQQVEDFQLPVPTPEIAAPRFWTVAVPRLRIFPARATARIGGSPAQPVVQSLTWSQRPEIPGVSLLDRDQADARTVFPEGEAPLLTVATYRAGVEQYIARVEEACAALERQWGPDRESWRIVARAIAAHGGRAAILKSSSFIEQVVNTAPKPMAIGRNLEYRSTRRVALPFQVREDFDYASARQAVTRILSLDFGGGNQPRSQTVTLDDTGAWQQTDGEMRPENLVGPNSLASQRHVEYARNALYHLVADTAVTLTALPGDSTVKVTAEQTGWPSLTLTFDAEKGLLTAVGYREPLSNGSPWVEFRFAQFRSFDGVVRPASRTMTLDGELRVTEQVESVRSATFTRSDFRNPYSPAVPFTPTPDAGLHQLTVINNHPNAAVLVCFDDEPDGMGLSTSERQTRSLAAGTHACTIVTWSPQAVQNHPYRIEKRTLRFNADRDGALVISMDPRDQGNFIAQLQ